MKENYLAQYSVSILDRKRVSFDASILQARNPFNHILGDVKTQIK